MDHLEFNYSAFALWENHFSDNDDVYVPLIMPPLVFGGLLFVGNNPSFSPDGFSRFLKGTDYSSIDPHTFFHWSNRNRLDFEIAMAIERLAKERYPYFSKFRDISSYVGLDWEHIDLFFFRETSQQTFKKRIADKSNSLTVFGQDQMRIFDLLLKSIGPKIIVVANAFASDVFRSEFGSVYDEDLGFHKTLINGRITPTILGSMLTGQRAMDRYSYSRLKWHVRKAREWTDSLE